MIISELFDFLKECPYFKAPPGTAQTALLNVDYMDMRSTHYAIEPEPGERVVKEYTDGSAVLKYNFALVSVEPFGQEVQQNTENQMFFEDFSDWLDAETRARKLPESWQKIEALTHGYFWDEMAETQDTGRYRIQCRVVYFKGVT